MSNLFTNLFGRLFRNNGPNLTQLTAQLKEGANPLDVLGLDANSFIVVGDDTRLNNAEDIAQGVIKVRIKGHLTVLKIFDIALIKDYDNGEVAYIFYCTTSDYKTVSYMFDHFDMEFGDGVRAEEIYVHHTAQRVQHLAKCDFHGLKEGIATTWSTDIYRITLKYIIDPKLQLALFVTKKAPKVKDLGVRKGTILALFDFDLNQILSKEEFRQTIEKDDGKTKFIDYEYIFDKKWLGVFDRLQVRIFSDERKLSTTIGTHLIFSTVGGATLKDYDKLTAKLVKIYGNDNSGYADLEPYEIDMISKGKSWTGRCWNLNEEHGLWDSSDTRQFTTYTVDFLDEEPHGLTLSVIGYDSLVKRFSNF